jgi:sterol desaturase/sphingolipid hydroxylase (fatty acid hydroxylase superfamily)
VSQIAAARLVRGGVYPVSLVGGVVLAHLALRRGVGIASVTVGAAFAANALVAVLERTHPFSFRWNENHDDVVVDLVHVPTTGIAAELGRSFAATAAAFVASSIKMVDVFSPRWPWPVALVAAVVIADLPVYVIHRWQHRGGLLWRIHAGHHAVPRLYFLNANRNHPIDVFLGAFTSLLLLGLVGATEQLLALVAVATAIHVTFQHGNFDARLGPLNALISGPEVHRFHHDRVAAVGNANYGGFTLVWDLVFRTRHVPSRRPSEDVGLVADEAARFPTSVWGVLSAPFRRSLFR